MPMLVVRAKDFVVTDNYSHHLLYKPSLSSRLSGVKDVILFEPRNKSQNEDYVISNLSYHLQQMGLHVNVIPVNYKFEQQQFGNVVGRYHIFDDDVLNYWNPINTIAFVINYVEATGYYSGTTLNLKLSAVDYLNDWQWNFDIDVPSKGDKLRKKFSKDIISEWNYNSDYAFVPHSKRGNFNQVDIEQNFKEGNYEAFEGVYEGDSYKLGMKKSNDGKYYLIYLGSKDKMQDWRSGDIKAELRESTTPGIFKGTWYGRWKQPMQYSFLFNESTMVVIDDDNGRETYIRMFPTATDISAYSLSKKEEWGGSAFALNDGYLVTNYHVIEGATNITIKGVKGEFNKSYSAEVIGVDKSVDLAILKISDSSFNGFGKIPYSITSNTVQVGEDIFVLGYPLTSTMGDEIKLLTGIVSSLSGYQKDASLYQISAPIQPGNSGGPLFDKKGNIIGVVSAKHTGAENVGYAVKSVYLCNLIESCLSSSLIPTTNTISTLPLTSKVSMEKDFVFMISCNNSTIANISKEEDFPNRVKASIVSNSKLLASIDSRNRNIKRKIDFENIANATRDPSHKYYYPNLVNAYHRNDTVMTVDEYFYLYYGSLFNNQKSNENKPLMDTYDFNKAYTSLELEELTTTYNAILKDDILNMKSMLAIMDILTRINKPIRSLIWRHRLTQLLQAILSTGDGSEESAWSITNRSHEDQILELLGYDVISVEQLPNNIDHIKVKAKEGYYQLNPIDKDYYFKLIEL